MHIKPRFKHSLRAGFLRACKAKRGIHAECCLWGRVLTGLAHSPDLLTRQELAGLKQRPLDAEDKAAVEEALPPPIVSATCSVLGDRVQEPLPIASSGLAQRLPDAKNKAAVAQLLPLHIRST